MRTSQPDHYITSVKLKNRPRPPTNLTAWCNWCSILSQHESHGQANTGATVTLSLADKSGTPERAQHGDVIFLSACALQQSSYRKKNNIATLVEYWHFEKNLLAQSPTDLRRHIAKIDWLLNRQTSMGHLVPLLILRCLLRIFLAAMSTQYNSQP